MTMSEGGGGAAAVVNDHIGPVVAPAPLCATICQKYVVLLLSADGEYDPALWPVVTCGGGLPAPNFTSYVVAFVADHVSVGVVLTPVEVSAGLGLPGVPGGGGGGGGAAVVNDQTGPAVAPAELRAVI